MCACVCVCLWIKKVPGVGFLIPGGFLWALLCQVQSPMCPVKKWLWEFGLAGLECVSGCVWLHLEMICLATHIYIYKYKQMHRACVSECVCGCQSV